MNRRTADNRAVGFWPGLVARDGLLGETMSGGKLKIRLNMNSEVEDVLAFKTCCSLQVQDPNLEILLTNTGSDPVEVRSSFDLLTDTETRHYPGLFPPGVQRIEPGETRALYCQMDEQVFGSAHTLVFQDTAGTRYPVDVRRG